VQRRIRSSQTTGGSVNSIPSTPASSVPTRSRRPSPSSGLAAIRRASQAAVEVLEARQLLTATIQTSTSGTTHYLAWEAENFRQDVNGGFVLTNDNDPTASGGLSVATQSPDNTAEGAGNTGDGEKYSLNFTNAGTYRLYMHMKVTGGKNSIWAPPVDDATGIGTDISAAPTTNVQSRYYEGADTSGYVWTTQRNADASKTSNYTVGVGTTSISFFKRESPFFVDRVVLSDNPSLTGAQLDALANSDVTVTAAPAAPTAFASPNLSQGGIDLKFNSPEGTSYNIFRSTTSGGEGATPINAAPVTGGTYRDATATFGSTYFYTVKAINTVGTSPASAEVSATPAPIGNGDGWTATYASASGNFNPRTVDGSINSVDATPGTGTFQRIEKTDINYAGNDTTPPINIPPGWNSVQGHQNGDDFAIRWEGYILAPTSEVYTFYPATDDGARVSVSDDLSDGDPSNDGLQLAGTDNIFADRGRTEDNDPAPVAFVAGHYYRVRFDMNEGGGGWNAELRWSSASTPKGFIPIKQVYSINPGAAQMNAPTPGNKQVALSWTLPVHPTAGPSDNTDAGLSNVATTYIVKRSATQGGPYTTVPNGTITVPTNNLTTPQSLTFVDSDPTLANGTTYYYVVQSDTNYPDAAGGTSNEVSATPANVAPVNPSGVKVTRANGSAANAVLSWTAFPLATGYNVYRAEQGANGNPNGAFTKITATPVTGTTFTDNHPAAGFYKVTSVNGSGEGDVNTAQLVYIGVGDGFSAQFAASTAAGVKTPRSTTRTPTRLPTPGRSSGSTRRSTTTPGRPTRPSSPVPRRSGIRSRAPTAATTGPAGGKGSSPPSTARFTRSSPPATTASTSWCRAT